MSSFKPVNIAVFDQLLDRAWNTSNTKLIKSLDFKLNFTSEDIVKPAMKAAKLQTMVTFSFAYTQQLLQLLMAYPQ
jgi:hypothetical protein